MARWQFRDAWKSGFVALGLLMGGCEAPEEGIAEQAVSSVATPLVAQQIIITPSMVQPDGVRPTLGAYQNLYDEQTLIGDPRGGWTFKPATTWGNVVYTEDRYPMGFVIDLGALYDVTEVGVFDTYDNVGFEGYVYFSVGSPGQWTALPALLTDKWEQWRFITVGQRTRYIHFARNMNGATNEIVIYGTPASGVPNVPPTASAGLDQTVYMPTSSAQLTGTASDSDGTVVSQQWSQVSGPSTASLTGANTLSATASNLVVGLYEFELRVTDDGGAVATSRTKVRVEPSLNGQGTMQNIYKSSTPGHPSEKYGYALYLPPGYATRDTWPIVIFLHGAGQRGDGSEGNSGDRLYKVRSEGLASYFDKFGKDYPFILVAPQTANLWNDYEAQTDLNVFIDRILATYKVDTKRVYLTGLSMGGAGTFAYAGFFPSKLAAAAPVCNGGFGASAPLAQNIVNSNLPLWATHAINDAWTGTRDWFTRLGQAMGSTGTLMDTYTYPSRDQTAFFRPATLSWEWVDGYTSTDASGNPPERPMIFSLFHTGGHSIWDRVYYTEPKMLSWMLAQQRP